MSRDMRGLWDEWYPPGVRQFRWGADDVTYKKAALWLDEPDWVVEDWGGGSGWAGKFFLRASYGVVDGSVSTFARRFRNQRPPVVADLQSYRSDVDGVLLRHVLEHNLDWRAVLANAAASAGRRVALVVFTPFGEVTRPIAYSGDLIPTISFNKVELLDYARGDCRLRLAGEEGVAKSKTYYGAEMLFYFDRIGGT